MLKRQLSTCCIMVVTTNWLFLKNKRNLISIHWTIKWCWASTQSSQRNNITTWRKTSSLDIKQRLSERTTWKNNLSLSNKMVEKVRDTKQKIGRISWEVTNIEDRSKRIRNWRCSLRIWNTKAIMKKKSSKITIIM